MSLNPSKRLYFQHLNQNISGITEMVVADIDVDAILRPGFLKANNCQLNLDRDILAVNRKVCLNVEGMIALLNFSSWCLLMVEWLFLVVPWGCLLFVIVVIPDHTHLLFLGDIEQYSQKMLKFYLGLKISYKENFTYHLSVVMI